MTITFTKPQTRESITTARLVGFNANAKAKEVEATYELGYLDGEEFKIVRLHTLLFNSGPEADFTFEQLVQSVPEVRNLARAMENEAIARGVFNGVVS